MSDLLVDMSSLTEEVREKLAELDLELSEGELCHYNSERRGRAEAGATLTMMTNSPKHLTIVDNNNNNNHSSLLLCCLFLIMMIMMIV